MTVKKIHHAPIVLVVCIPVRILWSDQSTIRAWSYLHIIFVSMNQNESAARYVTPCILQWLSTVGSFGTMLLSWPAGYWCERRFHIIPTVVLLLQDETSCSLYWCLPDPRCLRRDRRGKNIGRNLSPIYNTAVPLVAALDSHDLLGTADKMFSTWSRLESCPLPIVLISLML